MKPSLNLRTTSRMALRPLTLPRGLRLRRFAWLREVLRKYSPQLQQHLNMAPANLPREPVLKIEQQDFEEANEGLAAMCNGEALSADSPPPRALVAPATPPHARIKKEKFDQSYARFMLASSAWNRSLGSNAVIDLATPSPSRHGSTQGDDPLHLEATPPSETSHPELLPERAATSPRFAPASAPLPAPPTDMLMHLPHLLHCPQIPTSMSTVSPWMWTNFRRKMSSDSVVPSVRQVSRNSSRQSATLQCTQLIQSCVRSM